MPAQRGEFLHWREIPVPESVLFEAFAHLDEAESIHPNGRGDATVDLHRAFLHLDDGSLDQAGEEAATAFDIGEKKEDHIMVANSHLDHRFHDTAWEDLQTLKARMLRENSVDEVLLAWSQGAVGNKTFKQISEEYAALIIPKVWANEGRKVARVAAKLSTSPKKVRRALIRAGLMEVGKGETIE